jgi:predicted nucleic acid-binding protein
VIVVLDTSVLIDALTGPKRSAPALRRTIADGEMVVLPSLVLFEWLRGPRLIPELEAQEALFPRRQAVPFGEREAGIAAALYRQVSRPRGREIDLAVAACAVVRSGLLWTLNRDDFADLPGVDLYTPPPAPPAAAPGGA